MGEDQRPASRKLPDIPYLGCDITNPDDTSGEHYLFGALAVALQYLKVPVDYDYLMTASGCAFHWMTDAPDGASDACVKDALAASGYEAVIGVTGCSITPWEDVGETQRMIRHSIDAGVPAIAFWPFPFRALIIGYDNDEFIFKKYWHGEDRGKLDKGYLLVFRKKGEMPDRKEQVLNGIRLAVAATQTPADHNGFEVLAAGPKGFDSWVEDFHKPLAPDKSYAPGDEEAHVHWNGWMYMGLIDGREAAAQCLAGVAKEARGRERKLLSDLAALFKKEESLLRKNWIAFPMPHWFDSDKNQIWSPTGTAKGVLWTPELRKRGYATLMKAKEIEKKAFRKMEELVRLTQ